MINISKVIDKRSTFLSGGVILHTQNVKYFCHLCVTVHDWLTLNTNKSCNCIAEILNAGPVN